ncbi:NADH-quinone oxidoreductase subunit C, partial [Streptacidiphilus cavernicola]
EGAQGGTAQLTPQEATDATPGAPAAPASPRAPGAPRPERGIRRILLRTRIPRDAPALPTATGVFAGAGWHERETHEMFGIDFPGHPHLATLLLPEGFEGHPLRKEFVLAARVAKAWPGAKEPGESDHAPGGAAAPAARRRMLPPGVPDPNEWGPLAGTLPPVPERAARGAAARGPRAATAATLPPGERPPVRADRPRRNRSVDQGSASQATPAPQPAAAPTTPSSPATPSPAVPPTPPSPDAPWQVPAPQQTPPSTTGDDEA